MWLEWAASVLVFGDHSGWVLRTATCRVRVCSLMYKSFFHLAHNPFELTPDPSFLFSTKRHNEALAALILWRSPA